VTADHPASDGLFAIAAQIAGLASARGRDEGPLVIGVTGAVASGKSTFAAQLRETLTAGLNPPWVEVVCTDGFLMPNALLERLGLMDQKGFPPSYDTRALHATLTAIRTGPVVVPTYSHASYDVDPKLARTLQPPDILIVEGLNLHHRSTAPEAPDPLDLLLYLDAEEALLEAWFLARFMGLYDAAEHDPASFYARFRPLGREATEAIARNVWRDVNLKNLRENIVLARAGADLVILKGEDHAILSVEAAQRG
jgi:type I pantothenate kinase